MRPSLDKVVTYWYIFLAANLLTFPISPVGLGAGVISRDTYMIIMGIKLGFLSWLGSRWLAAKRDEKEMFSN
jgi:hypothetical protein